MSEIIKKIEASITGKRYATMESPLLHTKAEINKPVELAFVTEYFIGVRLGHTIKVDDSVEGQKDEAIRAIRRSITEFIFGEFRSLLRKAEYNLHDRNFDEAKKAIEEIETRMFYDQ